MVASMKTSTRTAIMRDMHSHVDPAASVLAWRIFPRCPLRRVSVSDSLRSDAAVSFLTGGIDRPPRGHLV